ncbi:MAG: hypothetical protein ACOYU0_02215 [Nitrospirota bacterium]
MSFRTSCGIQFLIAGWFSISPAKRDFYYLLPTSHFLLSMASPPLFSGCQLSAFSLFLLPKEDFD